MVSLNQEFQFFTSKCNISYEDYCQTNAIIRLWIFFIFLSLVNSKRFVYTAHSVSNVLHPIWFRVVRNLPLLLPLWIISMPFLCSLLLFNTWYVIRDLSHVVWDVIMLFFYNGTQSQWSFTVLSVPLHRTSISHSSALHNN